MYNHHLTIQTNCSNKKDTFLFKNCAYLTDHSYLYHYNPLFPDCFLLFLLLFTLSLVMGVCPFAFLFLASLLSGWLSFGIFSPLMFTFNLTLTLCSPGIVQLIHHYEAIYHNDLLHARYDLQVRVK